MPTDKQSTKETIDESNTNIRLVRHVDRSLLGQEEPQLVPLPIAYGRYQSSPFVEWLCTGGCGEFYDACKCGGTK